MKLLFALLKIIANIILFMVYAIISITIVNFLFGLILVKTGRIVPDSDDPVHLLLAVITSGIVFLLTVVFRKYFYIRFVSLGKKYKKVEVKPEQKVQNNENKIEEEMKIYIDKEIK